MNYRVVIHDMAKDDIRRNAQWWADKHSRVQAEKWFIQAFGKLLKLAAFGGRRRQRAMTPVSS